VALSEADELLQRLLKGDRIAAAKLISRIEDDEAPLEVLRAIHKHSGRAHIIGITGAPGAGKSTLVDKLADSFRNAGKKVGVICVDPSSPFTGGAVLGDRIRMQTRSTDKEVFIRSMGSRGSLGGLARATNDAVKVLDAMGKDVVIVETVGVGQGEVDVVRTADTIVVVLVPGMGDEVQTIKAGIMEIGDVFCVNKADRDGADRTVAEVQTLLHMEMREKGDWEQPVVKTMAEDAKGVPELIKSMTDHYAFLQKTGRLAQRRRRRSESELLEVLKSRLVNFVMTEDKMRGRFEQYVDEIARRERDPHEAAHRILDEWK
jgi:LAO/AO transport system kinase